MDFWLLETRSRIEIKDLTETSFEGICWSFAGIRSINSSPYGRSITLVASPEAEFLDVIGIKILRVSSLLFTVTSTKDFTPLPHLSKSGLKLVCNVNIIHRNLKSENSQD